VCSINAVKNVTARARESRKLSYKGEEQVMIALLLEIPKIEVKIHYNGSSSFASSHDRLE